VPVRTGVESARPAFEAMLAELLDVDADAGRPDTVCTFAVLATGADPSPELLTELDDLNRQVRCARLYRADGAVFVGDELLLSTLDRGKLSATPAAPPPPSLPGWPRCRRRPRRRITHRPSSAGRAAVRAASGGPGR
jgi:hypothetical protein